MSPDRFILVASTLILINLGATQWAPAEINSELDVQTDNWPPHWLEGLWKNESTTITCDGSRASKRFTCASYYIFTSGYRFSIYEGRRISATPMIGHTEKDDVFHCLFKMTGGRAAMRAEFTRHAQTAEYVSYLVSSSDGRRYKFRRQLARGSNEEEILKIIQATLRKDFYSPHSTSAKEIFESWIEDLEESLEEK